jgi:hypothetical protein
MVPDAVLVTWAAFPMLVPAECAAPASKGSRWTAADATGALPSTAKDVTATAAITTGRTGFATGQRRPALSPRRWHNMRMTRNIRPVPDKPQPPPKPHLLIHPASHVDHDAGDEARRVTGQGNALPSCVVRLPQPEVCERRPYAGCRVGRWLYGTGRIARDAWDAGRRHPCPCAGSLAPRGRTHPTMTGCHHRCLHELRSICTRCRTRHTDPGCHEGKMSPGIWEVHRRSRNSGSGLPRVLTCRLSRGGEPSSTMDARSRELSTPPGLPGRPRRETVRGARAGLSVGGQSAAAGEELGTGVQAGHPGLSGGKYACLST